MHCNGRYTLETKSNSTRSTESKVDYFHFDDFRLCHAFVVVLSKVNCRRRVRVCRATVERQEPYNDLVTSEVVTTSFPATYIPGLSPATLKRCLAYEIGDRCMSPNFGLSDR